MKTFYKFILFFFILIIATRTEAQTDTMAYSDFEFLRPRKVIYDEHEITLPNSLQFNIKDENESVVKGVMNENLVYISWQTTTEVNTSHFELQRSENGRDFEPIETITAGGISKSISSYSTTDKKAGLCGNRVFYRLKIIFINGKENFTDATALNLKHPEII